jgi:hypothetical protein
MVESVADSPAFESETAFVSVPETEAASKSVAGTEF